MTNKKPGQSHIDIFSKIEPDLHTSLNALKEALRQEANETREKVKNKLLEEYKRIKKEREDDGNRYNDSEIALLDALEESPRVDDLLEEITAAKAAANTPKATANKAAAAKTDANVRDPINDPNKELFTFDFTGEGQPNVGQAEEVQPKDQAKEVQPDVDQAEEAGTKKALTKQISDTLNKMNDEDLINFAKELVKNEIIAKEQAKISNIKGEIAAILKLLQYNKQLEFHKKFYIAYGAFKKEINTKKAVEINVDNLDEMDKKLKSKIKGIIEEKVILYVSDNENLEKHNKGNIPVELTDVGLKIGKYIYYIENNNIINYINRPHNKPFKDKLVKTVKLELNDAQENLIKKDVLTENKAKKAFGKIKDALTLHTTIKIKSGFITVNGKEKYKVDSKKLYESSLLKKINSLVSKYTEKNKNEIEKRFTKEANMIFNRIITQYDSKIEEDSNFEDNNAGGINFDSKDSVFDFGSNTVDVLAYKGPYAYSKEDRLYLLKLLNKKLEEKKEEKEKEKKKREDKTRIR